MNRNVAILGGLGVAALLVGGSFAGWRVWERKKYEAHLLSKWAIDAADTDEQIETKQLMLAEAQKTVPKSAKVLIPFWSITTAAQVIERNRMAYEANVARV